MGSSWEVGRESAASPLLPAPLAAAGHGAVPHVTILMATRNGAAFLEPQLESIAAQSHANWSLRIGDDGSDDGTRKIIAAFRARHPTRDIRLLEGPRRGAAANFLALLGHGPPPRAYVAFSDQDDIWLAHKLRRALGQMAAYPTQRPLLYGSRTIIADDHGRDRRMSRHHRRRLGFGNALVQNVIAGNTAMLNPAAARLMHRASAGITVPFHDWWLYLMVSAAGGPCCSTHARGCSTASTATTCSAPASRRATRSGVCGGSRHGILRAGMRPMSPRSTPMRRC